MCFADLTAFTHSPNLERVFMSSVSHFRVMDLGSRHVNLSANANHIEVLLIMLSYNTTSRYIYESKLPMFLCTL